MRQSIRDVEIKSGLSGNELIVLAGQTKLRNGLTVSATETRRAGNKPATARGTDIMNPIKFSLRYPAVTLILTAMVVMVGIHAFLKMQRTEDPTITIRTGSWPRCTPERPPSRWKNR